MESGGAQEEIRQPTAEEEALKRSTDCVYFLASPLTCKKGSECEYRHSEGARVNPRDCWFWLNGNCLNPKCSFRHPPLDGLIGVPSTPRTAAFPQFQDLVSAQLPVPHFLAYSTNKQIVPCYYFQKGNCLKGDRCPFMHGPPAAANAQDGAKVSASSNDLLQTQKKDSSSIKECTLQNISSQPGAPIIAVDKPKIAVDEPDACFDRPPHEASIISAKPFSKPEDASNSLQSVKKSLPTYAPVDDCPLFNQNHLPGEGGLVLNRNLSYQAQASDDRPQSSRDADEFLGESSPGFDVLVDNDDEDSGYLHNKDDFGRASVQVGRDLYPLDDYEYIHGDYELVEKHESDQYSGMIESDRLGQAYDGYELRRSRTSSERILDRSLLPERTHLPREAGLAEIDRSDLRHWLLKQRRLDGSRSAVGRDDRGEWYRRDRCYMEEGHHGGHHAQRDQQQAPCGSPMGNRLQGRIKLPGRSLDKVDMHNDKERDRRRRRGRLSPSRSVDFRMRDQERARRRSNDIIAGAKCHSSNTAKRDGEEPINFAGPKSLVELKSMKATEGMKSSDKVTKLQEFEGALHFEGPKPLNAILKRKRGAECSNGEPAGSGKDGVERSPEERKGNGNKSSPEEHKFGTSDAEKEEGLIPEEGELYTGQSSAKGEGTNADAMEDQDLEHYDEREGEYDYEAAEYGEYRTEDENAHREDDDEFDDEDDFARKVGVMYS